MQDYFEVCVKSSKDLYDLYYTYMIYIKYKKKLTWILWHEFKSESVSFHMKIS